MRGLSATELLDLMDRCDGRDRGEIDTALAGLARAGRDRDDLEEESLGRRERTLVQLRTATFGRDLALRTDCPRCGAMMELTLRTDDLIVPEPDADAAAALSRLEVEGLSLDLRPVTASDVRAALAAPSWEDGRLTLARRCCRVAGVGAPPSDDHLTSATLDAIAARLADLDPQADLMFDVTCLTCEHAWQPLFDISSLFWRELMARAELLLAEICDLASVFHWSEAEILALSPARRQAYLSLIRS